MNDKLTNDSAPGETDEPSTEADIEALIAKYSKPSRSSEKVEITNDKPTIGEWIQLIFGWIFVVIPMVAFGLYGAYYLVLGLPELLRLFLIELPISIILGVEDYFRVVPIWSITLGVVLTLIVLRKIGKTTWREMWHDFWVSRLSLKFACMAMFLVCYLIVSLIVTIAYFMSIAFFHWLWQLFEQGAK